MRAFPLSNWTELDVWRYIEREGIEIPALYFAKERPVVQRDGTWIMVTTTVTRWSKARRRR